MKTKLFIICLLIIPSLCVAQPDSMWAKFYGGAHRDYGFEAILLPSGGFALAGYYTHREEQGDDSQDAYLVIIDDEGNEEWSGLYGTEHSEKGFAIDLTLDSGYILAGKYSSPQSGYIVRIDSSGEQLWDHIYEDFREFHTVVVTEDGGFVLGGLYIGAGRDMGIMKIDGDGEVIWIHNFGGEGAEDCEQIIHTSDGGFLVIGWTGSFGAGGEDVYVVKLDEDGNEEWSETYGTRINEGGIGGVEVDVGGYAIVGNITEGGMNDDYDALLIRVDENGEELWTHTYGGGSDDFGSSIVSNENGGFTFAGRSKSYRRGSTDFYLVRTDSDGEELWSTVYGSDGIDECHSLLKLDDESYALFGSTYVFEDDERREPNMWLLKTSPDPAGVPRLLDPAFVSEFVMEAAYPNPFNSIVTIPFNLPANTNASIRVFDSKGRELTTLLTRGTRSITWNAVNAPSGQYFISLEADNKSSVQAVTLLR